MTSKPPPDWPPRPAPARRADGFIDAQPTPDTPAFPPPGAYTADTVEHPMVAGPSAQLRQTSPASPATATESDAATAGTKWHSAPPENAAWPPVPTEAASATGAAASATGATTPAQAPADTPIEAVPEIPSSRPGEAPSGGEPIWAGPLQPPWQGSLGVDPPRRRRTAVWIAVALTATLLLCGGGAASAYFWLRDSDNPGATDPATAVDRFLSAVYTQQNPNAANALVCREARDKTKLADRMHEIKTYSDGYQDPSYHWDQPAVSTKAADRAVVSVHLTMATGDEKSAEQDLRITVIRKTGWLVCDVSG